MDKDGVSLRTVTESDCGLWIAGSSVNNPVEFSVAIVNLAISHGFELEKDAWDSDVPVFLSGEADYDMIEDLGYVTDAALEFMGDILPKGFYFDFQDGLVLSTDDEDFE